MINNHLDDRAESFSVFCKFSLTDLSSKAFFSPLEILSAEMIHRKERVANQRAPFMNEKMLNFAEKWENWDNEDCYSCTKMSNDHWVIDDWISKNSKLFLSLFTIPNIIKWFLKFQCPYQVSNRNYSSYFHNPEELQFPNSCLNTHLW